MKYRLVAVGRLPDGRVQVLGAGDVAYELDKGSAWEDLNAIIDDDELGEPEPIERIAMGVDENHEAIRMIQGVATEMYGPMIGGLSKNAAVAVLNFVKKRIA